MVTWYSIGRPVLRKIAYNCQSSCIKAVNDM